MSEEIKIFDEEEDGEQLQQEVQDPTSEAWKNVIEAQIADLEMISDWCIDTHYGRAGDYVRFAIAELRNKIE